MGATCFSNLKNKCYNLPRHIRATFVVGVFFWMIYFYFLLRFPTSAKHVKKTDRIKFSKYGGVVNSNTSAFCRLVYSSFFLLLFLIWKAHATKLTESNFLNRGAWLTSISQLFAAWFILVFFSAVVFSKKKHIREKLTRSKFRYRGGGGGWWAWLTSVPKTFCRLVYSSCFPVVVSNIIKTWEKTHRIKISK